MGCTLEAAIQFPQKFQTHCSMLEQIYAVTLWIFVPVERLLEVSIVPVDQCRVIAFQPAFRVALCKRPAHDVEAFVNDASVGQDNYGNRSFG